MFSEDHVVKFKNGIKAIQWTGENLDECVRFIMQHFYKDDCPVHQVECKTRCSMMAGEVMKLSALKLIHENLPREWKNIQQGSFLFSTGDVVDGTTVISIMGGLAEN